MVIVTSSPSPSRPDSSAISDKIAEIRENKITKYEPLIRPEGGLTYTGFSDRDFARQLDILRALQGLGIVREEPFDYIRKCSRCDHHGMLVKVACPVCCSTNTDQGKVIEHLSCGNIDVESKFLTGGEDGGRGTAGLVCPKCKKKLKAIGVDYVKPGSFCLCLSCRALSPEGRMQFVCLNCGSSLAREEMKLEPLAAYVVDQEAVAKYLDSTGFQFHQSVVNALRSRGIKAAPRAAVTGSSQVQHIFDIIAYASVAVEDDDSGGGNSSNRPAVAVEIEKTAGQQLVDPESLLNFLARCLDAGLMSKVFVGIPGFSEEAKKLAAAHRIAIISSDGNNAEEVADIIATSMPEEDRVGEKQVEAMIESMREAIQTEQREEPAADINNNNDAGADDDDDRASLERMLRTIISAPKKEEENDSAGKEQD
ncbi:MAG TPA: hypothetical protein VJP79_05930 [Nitrososphaera sp.]|nr:hypothetical protein [Nitrososphaera sp.]